MERVRLPAQVLPQRVTGPRMDAYIPVIVGLPNFQVQQKLNQAIYNLFQQMIRDQGYFENPMTTITADYELKNNQRGILSLSLVVYSFSGGAHGMTVVKSLTMDIQTGRIYQLKDLFKPNSNYVKVISDLVGVQIKEREIPLITEYKGIAPDQDFYIADKALVVYFQLYELAPYAWGLQYFPISVYTLQKIINEEGPLGTMLY